MVVHVINGLKLSVDRGPNWLFVKLRPNQQAAEDVSQIADHLWSIASRHFIYRLVLELDELGTMPDEMIEQMVLLQERLAQCGGALRICGLSGDCAEMLRECRLDTALPNYATRQDAVLGSEATALREKLKEMMASAAGDGDFEMAYSASAHREPCLQ